MCFITRQLRVLLLAAAFAFSAAAEDVVSHNLSVDGGLNSYSYLSLKYKLPESKAAWGGIYVERGLIGKNGTFFGIDLGGGSTVEDSLASAGPVGLGIGLSLGYALDFPIYGLRLIQGAAIGYWYSGYSSYNDTRTEDMRTGNRTGEYIRTNTSTHDFFAPFVKIQWHCIELMYRGLIGYYTEDYYSEWASGNDGKQESVNTSDYKLDWNHHQFTVGFYLNKDFDYGGYSFERRLGTMAMNIVPGLGSVVLQKDYLWGGIAFGLFVGGELLYVIGTNMKWEDEKYEDIVVGQRETRTASTLRFVGPVMFYAGGLIGLVIPWTHRNPDTKTASGKSDGFNFAVLPKDGDLQYVGEYSKSF
jgi:hypothetical protein